MVNEKEIPIFIICRDRLTYLQRLIEALKQRNYNNLILIDNASTYPPLLEYYKTLPYKIIYNDRNFGHTVIANTQIVNPYLSDYYAYTDCDVVPDASCPDNFLEHFRNLLEKHRQIVKVGFGLRIDNLPDHYEAKQAVLSWESQFWKHEIEPGVFSAPIDTTFALVRPGNKVTWAMALRTAAPFIARHEPWYADSANLPEDILYYRAHGDSGIGQWK